MFNDITSSILQMVWNHWWFFGEISIREPHSLITVLDSQFVLSFFPNGLSANQRDFSDISHPSFIKWWKMPVSLSSVMKQWSRRHRIVLFLYCSGKDLCCLCYMKLHFWTSSGRNCFLTPIKNSFEFEFLQIFLKQILGTLILSL